MRHSVRGLVLLTLVSCAARAAFATCPDFQLTTTVPSTMVPAPARIVSADFNRAIPDLAVTNHDNLLILTGTGAGYGWRHHGFPTRHHQRYESRSPAVGRLRRHVRHRGDENANVDQRVHAGSRRRKYGCDRDDCRRDIDGRLRVHCARGGTGRRAGSAGGTRVRGGLPLPRSGSGSSRRTATPHGVSECACFARSSSSTARTISDAGMSNAEASQKSVRTLGVLPPRSRRLSCVGCTLLRAAS